MASADTIKEFLVSLGFKIESGQQRQFLGGIAGATAAVAKLAVATEAAAAGVVAAFARMGDGLEQLYYASRRTGSSVAAMEAIGAAAAQMGSSADAARGSLESIGTFIRANPGGASFISRLIGSPVEIRDATRLFEGLARRWQDMARTQGGRGMARARLEAQMFGVDERTMLAMMDGMGGFMSQYRDMARAAGVNLDAASRNAVGFHNELRKLGNAVDLLGKALYERIGPAMTQSLARFRAVFTGNFDAITRGIGAFALIVVRTATVFTQFVVRAIQAMRDVNDWWGRLSQRGRDMIEVAAGLSVAWRLLNTGFLLSPIGLLATLAATLLLLYDDYRVWQETGGKGNLLPWDKWLPQLTKARDFISGWMTWFDEKLRWVTGDKDGKSGLTTTIEALLVVLGGALMLKATTGVSGLAAAVVKLTTAMVGLSAGLLAKFALYAALAYLAYLAFRIPGAGSQEGQDMPGYGVTPAPGTNSPGLSEEVDKQDQQRGKPLSWFQRVYRSGSIAIGAGDPYGPPPEAKVLLDEIGRLESEGNYGAGNPTDAHGTHLSSATGKYQFIQSTWDEARQALGIGAATAREAIPADQDRAAWWLAKRDYHARTGRDLLADLKSGDPSRVDQVLRALSPTWTSLPGGTETQSGRSRTGMAGANVRSGLGIAPRALRPGLGGPLMTPLPRMSPMPGGAAGGGVTVSQNTVINIAPGPNAEATARAVAREQVAVNDRLGRQVRNTVGAVS